MQTISEDTTWTKAGGPYFVKRFVEIPAGVTLTVEPGAEIVTSGDTSFTIEGNLIAKGSIDEKIKFISNDIIPSLSLYFFQSESSIEFVDFVSLDNVYLNQSIVDLENLSIVTLRNSINIGEGSFLNISEISVDNIENGLINVVENSDSSFLPSVINVLDSNFSNIGDGPCQFFVGAGNKISLFNTNIGFSLNTPICILSADADIRYTTLDGGLGSGIEIFRSDGGNVSNIYLKKNKINNFEQNGIIADRANIEGTENEIESNETGIGLFDSAESNVDFYENSIANNSVGAVFLKSPSSSSSFIAKNNWWGDKSGPYNDSLNTTGLGNPTIGPIEISPWLLSKPGEKPECCSSVVFIPGIESSRLYRQQVFENQLWEPNRNADVEKLYLNTEGKSIDSNIYTRDIIKRTNVGPDSFNFNIYKTFSDSLDQLVVDGKINNWEAFPYDWRLDLDNLVSNGTKLKESTFKFIDEIENLSKTSKTGKITFVTHSNGGLLAKAIIQEMEILGKENLIDKFILVASPEVGTPVAIAGLLHGDEQSIKTQIGYLLNKQTARNLGENMPSAYNLLPSEKYFSLLANPEIIKFDSSVDKVNNFRSLFGNSIRTYKDMSDFLLGTKDGRLKPASSDLITPNVLNKTLLDKSMITHNSLDNWTAPANIEITQIAGWGAPTYKGLKYISKEECLIGSIGCSNVLDREPIYTLDGDATVVSPSATFLNTKTYFADLRAYSENNGVNIKHSTILENKSIDELIKNIIIDSTSTPSYISENKPTDEFAENLEVSVHSPVSIDVYDSLGNHTGKIQNPDITSDLEIVEEKIPNSSYIEFGEGKYVNLDPKKAYNIKLEGLDMGTFTIETKTSLGGREIASTTFADIPVNSDSKGDLIITATSSSIALDVEGDGKIDVVLDANKEVDPISMLKIIKGTIATLSIDNKTKTQLNKRIDDIIKSIEKGKIKNTLSKIKKFSKDLKSKTKHNKKHKLNKEDEEVLLKMINQLLDSLN